MIEVQNLSQGYSAGWDWVTKTNTAKLSNRCYARLIREAQRDYLDGYGFIWADWTVEVILSDEITAQIEWTHKVTERKLTLTNIYFDKSTGQINQAGTNYGDLVL